MYFLVNFLQFGAKMNLSSLSDESVSFLTSRIKIKMCFYLCRMFGYLYSIFISHLFCFFSLQVISLAMSHSVCQNLSEPQESVQQVNVGSQVTLDVCWSSELELFSSVSGCHNNQSSGT